MQKRLKQRENIAFRPGGSIASYLLPLVLWVTLAAATSDAVLVNKQKAGVRVAPPWKFTVTGLVKPGDNEIEILVCNTLANHYQTIPSLYRGNPQSGLFGPVKIMLQGWKRKNDPTTDSTLSSEGSPSDEK